MNPILKARTTTITIFVSAHSLSVLSLAQTQYPTSQACKQSRQMKTRGGGWSVGLKKGAKSRGWHGKHTRINPNKDHMPYSQGHW